MSGIRRIQAEAYGTPGAQRARMRNGPSGTNGGDSALDIRKSAGIQQPGAVTKVLCRNPGLVQNAQQEIGHRRVFCVGEMTSALEATSSTACHQARKIRVLMQISVSDSTAIYDHRMIEQGPIAVRRVT